MGFLQRLLSADYRRALAAEAAGDFVLAARLYAQAGEPHKVAEMHLLRVRPQSGREEVLTLLREAGRWAREASPPDTAQALLCRIGQALLREARRDAPTVPADRALLVEAARVLEAGGGLREAAECLEEAGEPARAAELFGRAGELARMESLLDREREQSRSAYALRAAWEEYRLELAAGRRSAARTALERCIGSPQAGAERLEYLRLRDELDVRRLVGGFVALRTGNDPPIVYTGFPVWLGREATSGLALRDGCVSRRHARIAPGPGGRLEITDCGSRNGTRLAGIPIAAPIALEGAGEIALGDDCGLRFEVPPDEPARLRLEVVRGRDRGWRLEAAPGPFVLSPGVELGFSDGRPVVRRPGGVLLLDGTEASSQIELVRGDRFGAAGMTWDVV